MASATLIENTRILPELSCEYAAISQFKSRLAFESTGTCCAVVKRLFKLWYSDDTNVSNRATETSLCGSIVFKPFSRNASITFQISTRCTTKSGQRGTKDNKECIIIIIIIVGGLALNKQLTIG